MEITDKMIEEARNGSGLKNSVLDWLEAEDEEYRAGLLEDLSQHGCISGMVGGLIYYHETVRFHDDHESEIWDMLEEYRGEFGHETIMEFIATLNGAKNVGDLDQQKNLLAWFAFEETARRIADQLGLEV